MEVLIQGQEFTNQLQLLLLQNMTYLSGDGVFEESALDLTTKIHQSFTDALSLLSMNANQYSGNGGTISDDGLALLRDLDSTLSPVVTGISSFNNSDDWKSSGDSKAIPADSSTDRKIGFKRRKTSHTWVKVTPTPVDDGHAWRKYGQKMIHDNEFPRSYYRCTYKKEQGCEANKQVQKTQDKPSMYQTTYKGHHTCKKDTSHLDVIDFMLDETDSACVINFQTNITTKQPTYTFSSSSFNTSVKKNDQLIKHNTETHQEYHPANALKNVTPSIDDNDLTITEFLLLADLAAFDSISREVHEVLGVPQTSL